MAPEKISSPIGEIKLFESAKTVDETQFSVNKRAGEVRVVVRNWTGVS